MRNRSRHLQTLLLETCRRLATARFGEALRTGQHHARPQRQPLGRGRPPGQQAHHGAIVGYRERMAAGPKLVADRTEHGTEARSVPQALEPLQTSLTLAMGLVRVLSAVVVAPTAEMGDGRHHDDLRRRIARQPIGHDAQALQPISHDASHISPTSWQSFLRAHWARLPSLNGYVFRYTRRDREARVGQKRKNIRKIWRRRREYNRGMEVFRRACPLSTSARICNFRPDFLGLEAPGRFERAELRVLTGN
jgi:hypothetical protein